LSEWAAKRHADWPAELHRREVGSDHPAIIGRQISQPIKNRLRSARRAIENNSYLSQACRTHSSILFRICIIKDTFRRGVFPPRLCRLRGRSRTVATFIELFLAKANQLIEVARISLEMQEMGAILRAWGGFQLDSLFSSDEFLEGRKLVIKIKILT
jgi:hypothetical protein